MVCIDDCCESDYLRLTGIWERSVRATHTFLSEDDIAEIREALIPLYFPNVKLYGVFDNGALCGFVGMAGRMIEMLFVDDCCRGKGYGSLLVEYAVALGADCVDVNEQNPLALGFYESKGFHIVGRDDRDEAGRPFPILHLSL